MEGPVASRFRHVHRAVSDLRRGVPVLLTGPDPLLVLSAETANEDGLTEIEGLAGVAPVLILSPARAAAILRTALVATSDAVAVAFLDAGTRIEVYQSLADPLSAQGGFAGVLRQVELPAASDAAIRLAKIARVLPAVLAVPAGGIAADVIRRHGVMRIDPGDVLAFHRLEAEDLRQIVTAHVPLLGAEDSRVVSFRSSGSPEEHLAILIGRPEADFAPLVRLHSACFTGDLLGSLRCDCGDQLRGAIKRMADEGCGILLYLDQEGRGIGLTNKLRAYGLQDRGLDTLDANQALGWGSDERNFLIASKMLRLLGVGRVRLLTNNPDKLDAMRAGGIEVVGREPHLFEPNGVNDEYLATKASRFGHVLD